MFEEDARERCCRKVRVLQVYWVGPLLGGALAALLHRWALTPRRPAPAAEPHDAEIPLNDKP